MTSFERPTLVRDSVYDHLRRALLDGDIAPGERLAEVELGQHLGVSRTPIREALMRLTQDGLLVAEANKGVRVRTVTSAEARDAYVVREELDGLAAALAAEQHAASDAALLRSALNRLNGAPTTDYREQTRLDLAYHRAVTDAAHNTVLGILARDLEQRVALIKHQTRTYNAHPDTAAQHAAILQAILDRDAPAAREAARAHVRTFAALVLSDLGDPT
ncbi:DNA-binding GntR family transcriptional regulator [Deinococcus metalli]|uniref:GntR family transcriptional regulator n=1 Tax=Deinococcus metalli TaxID=1141878 RepID=A0A7W8KCW1_9DEIO|nr:GntR family transcriptional regulator [Deinococcus metalli]MBB5375388.1 DNA-binding GntR family transcriptional regulator [Deinococcus metalli]GHF29662.1 GntR family transcriptional regulator [Deinococcus metalli]